ncbi:MAG TPA: hypothetical protein VGC79_37280 [Polyangiaceae bacterium]
MPIVYDLKIDLENVDFSYGEAPTNATWVADESGAVAAITFDSEALVLGKGPALTDPTVLTFSPFIQMAQMFRDILAYKAELSEQLTVIRHRNEVGRLFTHIENQNWDLVRAELTALGCPDDTVDAAELRHRVQCLIGETQHLIIRRHESATSNVESLFRRALTLAKSETKAFFVEYMSSGRLRQLWHQFAKARNDFTASAPAMIPLLQVKHWKVPPASLADCQLLNKQFEALKALYIDCFETLARVSVVLIALHGLGAVGRTDVTTKLGSMDIWEFEKIANANKGPHLGKASDCAFLVPYLDTTLRNGIGHNSARYDAATDQVLLYKQRGANLEETSLSYTEFASKVLDVGSLLLELNLVAFWLVEANNGRVF